MKTSAFKRWPGLVLGEAAQVLIAGGDRRVLRGPIDSQIRIGPTDSALAGGIVDGIDLVEHIRRLVAQNAKAVSEAGGNPEQSAVHVRQLDRNMLAESG